MNGSGNHPFWEHSPDWKLGLEVQQSEHASPSLDLNQFHEIAPVTPSRLQSTSFLTILMSLVI